MSLNTRTFLRWDEAAQLIGMDREGLRQALLYQWSPTHASDLRDWLPVMLTLPGREYMARLQWDSSKGQPDFYWNGRDSYYRNCEGKGALTFSDGSSLPLRGDGDGSTWDATHGYGSGFGQTFTVGGDKLVISPETVAAACAAEGHIGVLMIAPLDWCMQGFPFDLCFAVVDCKNTFYESQPRDLFESALFLRSDVTRMLEASRPSDETKQIDERERASMLRIIRALDAMANLPKRGAATSVEAQLQILGFLKPSEATIRNVIEKARRLEPDNPQ